MFIFSPSGFILEEVKPFFPLLYCSLFCIAFLQKKEDMLLKRHKKRRQTDRHTHTQNSAIIYIDIDVVIDALMIQLRL